LTTGLNRSRWELDRQPSRRPCPESTGEIFRIPEAEIDERRGGKTGGIAIVANDDEVRSKIVHARLTVVRDRIASPFQHLAVDVEGVRNAPLAAHVDVGAGIDKHGSGGHCC
jgi:hypothetical protein